MVKKLFAPLTVKIHFLFDEKPLIGDGLWAFVECNGKHCGYCGKKITMGDSKLKVSKPVEYDLGTISTSYLKKDARVKLEAV